MSTRPQSGAFAVALAAMLAAVVALQVVRDRTFAANMVEQDFLYVTSGEVMKRAALSYDAIAADVYWIRALQHFGGERQKAPELRRFELLYPLLDLTTTLDPLFTVGYRFGAIFLAEAKPGGAGRPDDAIRLLEKGIRFNPSKWEYHYDIGFIYYWHRHDYERAAEWFDRGGKIEGAPWWLRTYAAVMLTRGGDRQASRAMWVQIGQSEESEWLRQTAQLRLAQLDALDNIDTLRTVVAGFTNRTGRVPATWEEVAAAGLIKGLPLDPAGIPYAIEAGDVVVRRDSPLWPLPTEPAAAPELRNAEPPPVK